MTSTTTIQLRQGPDLVPQGLELYHAIFNGISRREDEEHASRFTDESLWNTRATEGILWIAYKSTNNSIIQPIGFCLAYPKSFHFHIWLVGVLESERRQGCWNRLWEATVEEARQRRDMTHLTICTYPQRFPAMYHSLVDKHGLKPMSPVGMEGKVTLGMSLV